MQGPYPAGTHHNISEVKTEWERDLLIRGSRYHVIKSFIDLDGDKHPVGEEWSYIGSTFSTYDNELILFVCTQSGEEWSITLCWNPQYQQEVIENFTDYVKVGKN